VNKLKVMKDGGTRNSRTANCYCQGQSTAGPLGIVKVYAIDSGLNPTISGIGFTEITRARIKTDSTFNTTGRKSLAASIQRHKRSLLTPHVASCSPERKVNNSRDRNVVRNIPSGKLSRVDVEAHTLDVSVKGATNVVLPERTYACFCAYLSNRLRGIMNSKYLSHQ